MEIQDEFRCISKFGGRIHDVSSLVPVYPVQQTRYNSLHLQCQWYIFESRTSAISNSGSLSTKTGFTEGGGGWTQSGIMFRVTGSSIEMWNTGWMTQRLSGRQRVTEWVPSCAVWSQKLISKLLRRTGSMEELHLDEGPTPNQEFQSQGLMSISSTLIPELPSHHMLS